MNAWYICLNVLSQNSKFNFLKRHIFKIQSDACVKFQNTHSLIANIHYVSWMRDYACQHSLLKGKTQNLSPWKRSQSNPCLAALEAHSHWNCMLLRTIQFTHTPYLLCPIENLPKKRYTSEGKVPFQNSKGQRQSSGKIHKNKVNNGTQENQS